VEAAAGTAAAVRNMAMVVMPSMDTTEEAKLK
jgi:hypothetical protein